MNRHLFSIFFFLVACSGSASAEENPPCKFPTGNAAWTVDIFSKSKSLHAVRVDVILVDGTQRTRFTWSNGTSAEKWSISGLPVSFNQNPNTKEVKVRQNGSPIQMTADFATSHDASAFTWITPGCLQEKEPVKYGGVSCYHYMGTSSLKRSADEKEVTLHREAWIDEKTLLPVALVTGEKETMTVSSFKFDPNPPTEKLQPPKEFSEAIGYYKAVMGFR